MIHLVNINALDLVLIDLDRILQPLIHRCLRVVVPDARVLVADGPALILDDRLVVLAQVAGVESARWTLAPLGRPILIRPAE